MAVFLTLATLLSFRAAKMVCGWTRPQSGYIKKPTWKGGFFKEKTKPKPNKKKSPKQFDSCIYKLVTISNKAYGIS